jgi:hypothetical protein
VVVYHDVANDSWFVEERELPDGGRRHRWCDLTERQAADLCLRLGGDGTGWIAVS